MQQTTLLKQPQFPDRAIAPVEELGAYEALWARDGMTFKRVADIFRDHPDALPSDVVDPNDARQMTDWVTDHFKESGVSRFGVVVHGAAEYPDRLRDARNPVEVLTYQGLWNWTESPSIAVVGTRKPSRDGTLRAKKLVRHLFESGYTVVSGLATGIDTVAHTTALELGAATFAVIGTPLSQNYPRENAELQARIAREFCVVSQVPAYRYSTQDYRINRNFFPERNITMSALTEATVIVEAGETSGTLTQARAALHQGRKLFILDSCFQNPAITWPAKFEAKGAIRLREFEELKEALSN